MLRETLVKGPAQVGTQFQSQNGSDDRGLVVLVGASLSLSKSLTFFSLTVNLWTCSSLFLLLLLDIEESTFLRMFR